MENFVPGLREAILSVSTQLRVIVFFLCTAGLILQVRRAGADIESLVQPIVKAALIVGLVATLPYWFGFTENVLLSVADTVNTGYQEHPMRAAKLMRETVGDSTSEFSLRRVQESFYKAFLWAAAKLVVFVGSLLQLPFLLFQHILKLLCYLFLPVALGLFMVPGFESLGARYIQQTLAVLAWPVGFAVTDLAAYHLLTAYQTNVATLAGVMPGQVDSASLASLLGGLLATIWIVVGTLGTPFVMQMLLCNGAPVSGGGQSALSTVSNIQQLTLLLKSLKSGPAAPAIVAATGAVAAAKATMTPAASPGATAAPAPAASSPLPKPQTGL